MKMIIFKGHLIFLKKILFMVQIWCNLTYFYLSCSLYYIIGDVIKTQVYISKILRTLKIGHPYVYCNLENLLVIPPHSKYNNNNNK
jgi:hypothetical protein